MDFKFTQKSAAQVKTGSLVRYSGRMFRLIERAQNGRLITLDDGNGRRTTVQGRTRVEVMG